MRSADIISMENFKQVILGTEGRITLQWILEKNEGKN